MKKKLAVALAGVLALVTLSFYHSDIPVEDLKREYASTQSKWLPYQGTKLHYRDEGSGFPIVLIHGTSASLHTWDGWADRLKKKFRVIRFDLPAFGLTGPRPDANYSIDSYIKAIHFLVDKLNINKFHLAGNSLGGFITWRYALKYPAQLKSMVLIDSAGYPRESSPPLLLFGKLPVVKTIMQYITPGFVVSGQVKNVYGDNTRIKPGTIGRYFNLLLRQGNRKAVVEYIQQLMAEDYALHQKLSTIQTPTLILWGDKDNLIPLKFASRFDKDMKNSQLIIYKGVGHIPMEEIPEKSAADVERFFQRL